MISDQDLIEKYGRLCGFVAQTLVRKSSHLTQEDAEDFAASAHLKLIKCPPNHRHEDPYIRTIINNAIRTAWGRRIKQLNAECFSIELPKDEHIAPSTRINKLIMERTSGDGLPDRTQRKYDAGKMAVKVQELASVERTVMELHYGLNGCKPISLAQIARKLGRSKSWAFLRVRAGADEVRQSIRA